MKFYIFVNILCNINNFFVIDKFGYWLEYKEKNFTLMYLNIYEL